MLIKRILSLILILALLTGTCTAFASAAGSKNDPLVSLSYAKTWSQNLLKGAVPSIDSTLTPFYRIASANAVKALAGGASASVVSLGAGGALKLSIGSGVTLLSGEAAVKVDSGAFVNVTVGSAAATGKLNRYHRYIVCENSSATVTADAASLFVVDGTYSKTAGTLTFKDVKPSDWFYSDVSRAVTLRLIDGMTASTYVPGGTLTVAQAVKLAACLHQLHNDGEVTLKNGKPWYRSYADYALKNSIITEDFANYDAIITRQQFVKVFYNALPAEEYAAINTIEDGKIPDVAMTDTNAAEIYAFYRAGILTGYSDTPGIINHSFGANTTIVRSEVAAILIRMFDQTTRKTFTVS
ncbi:MAG: S-layer homology domain-containing protein [Oscillospiraceae bacterium]